MNYYSPPSVTYSWSKEKFVLFACEERLFDIAYSLLQFSWISAATN